MCCARGDAPITLYLRVLRLDTASTAVLLSLRAPTLPLDQSYKHSLIGRRATAYLYMPRRCRSFERRDGAVCTLFN